MKKALEITGKVVTGIILAFAVCVMIFTVISVNTVGKDADFLGYKPYIVQSDSMKDTFAAGDLTVSKKTDPDTLEVGDIITFRSIDPASYGEVVTHKIRAITEYEGEPAFVTYGTTTGVDDSYPVPYDNVLGEYQFRLPKMGYFFEFLKSPAGYFTVILLPFLLLIVLQGAKFFRLVRQYKAEQQAELEAQREQEKAELAAERERLEAERLQSQQLMAELQKLKKQLDEKQSGGDPPDTPAV